MALKVSFELACARLETPAGVALCAPLLDPAVAWIGGSAVPLAEAFSLALQRRYTEHGRAVAAMAWARPLSLEPLSVELEAPAAPRRGIHPDLKLRFDALRAAPALEDGAWIGFVPALGLMVSAPREDALDEALREGLELEFARKKRLRSARAVLVTRWYASVDVASAEADVPFYTFNELREIRAQREKPLLPQVASLRTRKPTARGYGLDEPLERARRALRSRFSRSLLLVGPSGVGKSALVDELVWGWGDVPELADRALWQTTAARLLQSLTALGRWQQGLERLAQELRDAGAILYLPSLSDLFEVGQYEGNDVSMAELLRPRLAAGELTLISECTEPQAARLEARAPGYLDAFQIVRLPTPDMAAAEAIVRQKIRALASARGVSLDRGAIHESIRLQERFAPYSGFPGRAIRSLESLVSARNRGDALDRGAVIADFCEASGVPQEMVDPDAPLSLEQTRRHFQRRVYGQVEAVDAVVDLLAEVKTAMARRGRPIASLLFAGPTGVGKTETAKVLAEFMFGHRRKMIRLDMSEYASPAAVARLIGEHSASGDGALTGAVRREPFSLVLFDEIEKAHPLFYDLLLQVLGEGRLTDARGRVADFCSAVVVMTSNLGAEGAFRSRPGFARAASGADIAAGFRRAVEGFFRPELFNRLDRVIAFRPLDRPSIERVLDRELTAIEDRPGLKHREVAMTLDDDARALLAEAGYDPAWGARHLKRAVRDRVTLPLARALDRYGDATPLIVSIEGPKDPEVPRALTIAAHALPARQHRGDDLFTLADRAAGARRRVQAIADGPAFAELSSRWTILDRRRQKLGDRFWRDMQRAEPYSRLSETLQRCRAAFEAVAQTDETLAVRAIEGDTGEDRAALDGLREQLAEQAETVREVMLELYTAVNPEPGICTIGVYGAEAELEGAARLWLEAAEARGYQVEARYLMLIDGALGPIVEKDGKKKIRPASAGQRSRLEADGARLVGIEIEIKGPAAWLFFDGEGGLYIQRDRANREHRLFVSAARGPRTAFQRPRSPHRKLIYQGRWRRRQSPHLLEDREYKLEIPANRASQQARLIAHMTERFERALARALGVDEGDA